MNLTLHFLEAEGSLAAWRAILTEQVKTVSDRISELVPLAFHQHAIDVLIQFYPEHTIPGFGMGGCCYRRSLIGISLDPGFCGFSANLEQGLFKDTVAHELHHAMRWQVCGYGQTLGEAMVSEGFAQLFAGKVTGAALPPWTDAVRNEDWPGLLDRAKAEIESQDYNHGAWFFGHGDLPKWAAHTIGYRLACLYEQERGEFGLGDIIDIPSLTALALWDRLKAEGRHQRDCS